MVVNYKDGMTGKFIVKGDASDYGHWLYYILDLKSIKKEDLETTLDCLVELTADFNSFLSYKKDDEEISMYLIRFQLNDRLMEEKEFFELCSQHSTLRPKILKYIQNVTPIYMDEDNTWQNEMHHRGIYAIAPLVFSDSKYAPDLGRLLNKWYMSSEYYQSPIIKIVFNKYGINKDTLQLLAWRVVSGGQSCNEDIKTILSQMNLKKDIVFKEFIDILNNIIKLDKRHDGKILEYGLQDFIVEYAQTEEECQALAKEAQNFFPNLLGKEFVKGVIDEYQSNNKEAKGFTYYSNTYDEINWDKDEIDDLVIGDYLQDLSSVQLVESITN